MQNIFCQRKKVKDASNSYGFESNTEAELRSLARGAKLPPLSLLQFGFKAAGPKNMAIPSSPPMIPELRDPAPQFFSKPKTSNKVFKKAEASTVTQPSASITHAKPQTQPKAALPESKLSTNPLAPALNPLCLPPKDFDIENEEIKQKDLLALNLQQESDFLTKRNDLLKDNEKRLALLSTAFLSNGRLGSLGARLEENLLADSPGLIAQITNAEYYIESILNRPFKLLISKSNVKKKALPAEYPSVKEYKAGLLDIFLDEIKASFISTLSSDEFKSARAVSLEANYMYQEDKSSVLLQLSIPSDAGNDKDTQGIQYEFDKSSPIVYITLTHRKKKKVKGFIGMKAKQAKESGLPGFTTLDRNALSTSWAFKFSHKLKKYFNKNVANQKLPCKFFANFVSQKRELKAILKIPHIPTELLAKIIKSPSGHLRHTGHTGGRRETENEQVVAFSRHSESLAKKRQEPMLDDPRDEKLSDASRLPAPLNRPQSPSFDRLALRFDINPNLNESQKEAVLHSLNPGSRIKLIQGPPGTGKSHTVVELVRVILENESSSDQTKKILICTPSNTALDELMLRFKKTFDLYDYVKQSPTAPEENNPKADKEKAASTKDKGLSLKRVKPQESLASGQIRPKVKVLRIGKLSEGADPQIIGYGAEVIAKLSSRNINKEDELRKQQSAFAQLNELLRKKAEAFHNNPDLDRRISALEREIEFSQNLSKRGFKQIERVLVENAKIIFCTLNTSAKKTLKAIKEHISVLIVDESSQATEIQSLIPLRLRPERVILIGDPCQLPATTFHPHSRELRLERSLFERLMKIGYPVSMLKVQYRMAPQIASFPSIKFYHGLLQNAARVCAANYAGANIRQFIEHYMNGNHLVFLNTVGRTLRRSNSYYNIEELEKVIELLVALDQHEIADVGVISPYKEQCRAIRRESSERGVRNLEVNTVDGFQGREKDVIILSCVKSLEGKSNKMASIGFLDDPRRLNVSITRARHLLIVVGDKTTLSSNPLWNSYISFLSEKNLVENASSSITARAAKKKQPLLEDLAQFANDRPTPLIEPHDEGPVSMPEVASHIDKLPIPRDSEDLSWDLKYPVDKKMSGPPTNVPKSLKELFNGALGKKSKAKAKASAQKQPQPNIIDFEIDADDMLV